MLSSMLNFSRGLRQEDAALLRLEANLFGSRAMVQVCFQKELRKRTESGCSIGDLPAEEPSGTGDRE